MIFVKKERIQINRYICRRDHSKGLEEPKSVGFRRDYNTNTWVDLILS